MPHARASRGFWWLAGLFALSGCLCIAAGGSLYPLQAQQPSSDAMAPHRAMISAYCVSCHNERLQTAGLALDTVSAQAVGENAKVWEKVVRKLRGRQMPPLAMRRPDENTYNAVVGALEASLDLAAQAKPNPGRTDTFRRLNRTEYRNAIRDLLALDVDVSSMLPGDESSYGFDNITVGDLSPTSLERYVSAAEKVSRLAVGGSLSAPGFDIIRMPPDFTQEKHVEGLPIGTRGGVAVPYNFPLDAEYEFQIRLTRDRDEHVEGLRTKHELELLLDGERLRLFTVEPPPEGKDHALVDEHLKIRIPVKAGPHALGATFLQNPWPLLETERQPYEAHFNSYRHPRIQPAIKEISIFGPYGAASPGDTPSRKKIFVCRPGSAADEEGCAKRILETLMHRAYRRPVVERDFQALQFYREGRAEGSFETGIERALAAILVSPEFLFRIERDPVGVAPNSAYRISDLELASRLSFFLWSSIPDDELLDAAIQGLLKQPAVLQEQVRRMLADRRAHSLVTNFASQWLHLRNLSAVKPDMRLFPDFDDNLRQALREETELFIESIIREDRNVLDLLRANYTFVNERLAKHYRIPNVYGSRFRRITLEDDSKGLGLLRQGSILTVTSYATRTSPVIRGKWILENFLGVPPPPPPASVPPLKENTIDGSLSVRDRLAEHRRNPACSGCHSLMDPVGFSLENFDAIGRWRTNEQGKIIDASGGLPDGSKFERVAGLDQALLHHADMFVNTLVEKLLTYALGRGVEYYDAPAVRKIVRDAQAQDFRFSSLISGIVNSAPFQMRTSR